MKLSIFIIQCYNQELENTDPTPGMLIVVGNKRKGRFSKRMFQKKNKACQIFQKTNIFYPLIHTRMVVISSVWVHLLHNSMLWVIVLWSLDFSSSLELSHKKQAMSSSRHLAIQSDQCLLWTMKIESLLLFVLNVI